VNFLFAIGRYFKFRKKSIRAMRKNDISSIIEIENTVIPDAWNANKFLQSINNKQYINLVYVDKNIVLAYLVAVSILNRYEILKIAVARKFQQQKIASKLLQNLFWQAKKNNIAAVDLEVREHNLAAINLYEKLGFKKVGVRKNYYFISDGYENALTYTLTLY